MRPVAPASLHSLQVAFLHSLRVGGTAGRPTHGRPVARPPHPAAKRMKPAADSSEQLLCRINHSPVTSMTSWPSAAMFGCGMENDDADTEHGAAASRHRRAERDGTGQHDYNGVG
mmetsp:Transcript_11182/g.25795  ORF Transcript_11182/g.25795 Transcript_11182/m.25795 type:complete len:115 (-) Transcript_11182:27-371(-)